MICIALWKHEGHIQTRREKRQHTISEKVFKVGLSIFWRMRFFFLSSKRLPHITQSHFPNNIEGRKVARKQNNWCCLSFVIRIGHIHVLPNLWKPTGDFDHYHYWDDINDIKNTQYDLDIFLHMKVLNMIQLFTKYEFVINSFLLT